MDQIIRWIDARVREKGCSAGNLPSETKEQNLFASIAHPMVGGQMELFDKWRKDITRANTLQKMHKIARI